MGAGMLLPCLLFVVGLVVIIFLVIRNNKLAEQRRQSIAGLAQARGWTYVQRDDAWSERFNVAPFQQGHNRQAHNIIAGQFEGRGFVAMDYLYYTTEHSTDSDGNSRSSEVAHPYGVVVLNTGANFPPLSVTPEGFFGRFIGRLTNTDIELESEDFNRMFTVTSDSRRFASDLLHPQMMELLMQEPHFAFCFDGPSIMSSRPGASEIPEITARLAMLDAIIDRVPEHVWRNLKGE